MECNFRTLTGAVNLVVAVYVGSGHASTAKTQTSKQAISRREQLRYLLSATTTCAAEHL
jgi:hypothetical protein